MLKTKQVPRQPDEFPAHTAFGKLIRPLVEQLKALPPEKQTESLETLKPIHDFVKNHRLPDTELTKDDVVFLITNKVGDLIRRPLLHTYFAQTLEDGIKVESESEKKVKDILVKAMGSAAWSKFAQEPELADRIAAQYPDGGVLVDYTRLTGEFSEAIKKTPMSSYLILLQATNLAERFHQDHAPQLYDDYNRWSELDPSEQKYRYYTDPDHPFSQGFDLMFARQQIQQDLGLDQTIKLPALVREASFMLVEDNPLHGLLADVLNPVENLVKYAPREEDKAANPLIQEAESKGLYASAERALEVMYNRVGGGGVAPDVILSDIELLGEMNGIRFVRGVYGRERAAGRNPMILMLYSSNPGPYLAEIEKLKGEGIIMGSWHKKDFSPEKMIEAVNEELSRRGA